MQRGRCDKHGVYSEWTGTERAGQAWRWEVSPRPSVHYAARRLSRETRVRAENCKQSGLQWW